MILIPHWAELRLVGWISWLIICQDKRFRDSFAKVRGFEISIVKARGFEISIVKARGFETFITHLLERSAEQFRFKTRDICEVWRINTWWIFTSDGGKPAETTSAKHIFRVCKAETQTSRTRYSLKGHCGVTDTFQSTRCLTPLQYGYLKKSTYLGKTLLYLMTCWVH